jgi:hypothetical protein
VTTLSPLFTALTDFTLLAVTLSSRP